MADFEDDPIMQQHFATAGIEPDAKTDDKTADTTTAGDDKSKETTDATSGQTADQSTATTAPGDATKVKSDDKSGDKQTATGADSKSGGTNGDKKSGQETKVQVTGNPRDLTLNDGTVIKGGVERRWYETAQLQRQKAEVAQQTIEAQTRQIESVQAELNTMKGTMQTMSVLPVEQQASAARLYSDLGRDPVGTVTKLLAELKAKGHTVEGIGGAVDTMAVQAMLDRRDQQRVETTQQRATPEEINNAAAAEVGQFFAKYPDAVVHDDTISQIISKHPGVSLDTAYFQLRQQVIEQGYDWSQPLGPQVKARQGAQSGQDTTMATQPNKGQQQQQAPMNGGRGAVLDTVVLKDSEVHPAGETYDDIIRAAMTETGYALNTR